MDEADRLKSGRASEARTREIVGLVKARGLTRREIAEQYNISPQRVAQIVKRAARAEAPDDGLAA
jgi:DNA-directed RNA polymerase specialized sigma subunit